MLERVFFFGAIPLVYLLPISHRSIQKHKNTVIKIHIMLVLTLLFIYFTVRNIWCVNCKDLPKQIKSKFHKEFTINGCKCLYHEPIRKKKRRILLFPGLGISVRRMMQESCMEMFVEDSEILCFQIRGLGESDWDVDLSSKSMLDDSINMMTVFESMTDRSLDTLFVGYSLGSFVSMQSLAYANILGIKCDNILLVNAMCSGTTILYHYKIFCMLLGVNTKLHLNKSNVPITILHAIDDITIPLSEAQELKQECDSIGRSCTLLTCDGSHSNYTIPTKTKSYLRLLSLGSHGSIV